MPAATVAAILALITAALNDAPAIIADIEKLIGQAKSGTLPGYVPIGAQLVTDTAADAAALNAAK
jgi:hypothetical protein